MTTIRPKIILTNDDGITAPGLFSLWRALVEHVDITIVAPASNQSGKGLSITTLHPLHITPVDWAKNTNAYKVDGTPADCIKLALDVLLPTPPDMIVSGINRGSNAGRNVLYSGTVGGVIEGAMRNIPGIAFSCADYLSPQYEKAEAFIFPLVHYLLQHPLENGTFLNATFPDETTTFRGIRMAEQGKSYWLGTPEERVHPSGHRYYWLGGDGTPHPEHEESDVELVKQGYLTVVPLRVHQLTDLEHIKNNKTRFESWFAKKFPTSFALEAESTSLP